MCDICLEIFAVYTVECETAGETVDLDSVPMDLFLQETRSVAEAVLGLEKRPEPKSNSIGAILLCRVLDILQGGGTDSREYEEVLCSAWVRQTIATECASDLVTTIRAMDLPFLNEDALLLYQPQTYFPDGKVVPRRLPIFPASWRVEVLRHLRDWWLKGDGLELDPDALVPGFDLMPHERARFKGLLRVYYLALQQVENSPEERQLLRDIVAEFPFHSWGLDLWLKRRALARLAKWDPLGLPVLETENCDVLYYCAALKSGMFMKQREQLAKRLEAEAMLAGPALLRGGRLKDSLLN